MKTLQERLVLARSLKSERDGAEFTQTDLAKKAGVSQGAIAHLESGRTLTSRSLTAIAEVLGVQPRWLAEGKGTMFVEGSPEHDALVNSWVHAGRTPEVAPEVTLKVAHKETSPKPAISLVWADSLDLELMTLFHGTDDEGRDKILRTARKMPRVVPAKAVGNQS